MNKCKYCGFTGTNDEMEKHAGEMCFEKFESIEKNIDGIYDSLKSIADIIIARQKKTEKFIDDLFDIFNKSSEKEKKE